MITTIGVRLKSRDGSEATVSVSAEPTPAAGLFIVPEISNDTMTGFFTLTHGASGLRLPTKLGGSGLLTGAFAPEELDVARRVGAALADVGVDWTLGQAEVMEQITANSAAVIAAVHKAKLDLPDPNERTDMVDTGPAPYPRDEHQATAEALARHLTHGMQYRVVQSRKLIGEARGDNEDGTRRYDDNLQALISEWGLVYVLREVAKLDPEVADRLARQVWSAWEDGGSVYEFTHEWASYYGLPKVKDDEDTTLPERPVGFRLLTEPGKLPYFEGSVNDLRRVLAFTAWTAGQRYGELVDAGRSMDKPWPEEHVRDVLLTNSAAHFGWVLVALLRFLGETSPALARRVAAMIDDVGVNGGNGFMDDLEFPPVRPNLTPVVDTMAAAQPVDA